MLIEYLFCFGQMSFWLFEFRNIGKFGDYLIDNVLKIAKKKKDRSVRIRGRGGGIRPKGVPFPASGIWV